MGEGSWRDGGERGRKRGKGGGGGREGVVGGDLEGERREGMKITVQLYLTSSIHLVLSLPSPHRYPTHLADDMKDEPARPCPAVVPAQQCSQRQQQPPCCVHQGSMEMDKCEGGGRTADFL